MVYTYAEYSTDGGKNVCPEINSIQTPSSLTMLLLQSNFSVREALTMNVIKVVTNLFYMATKIEPICIHFKFFPTSLDIFEKTTVTAT